MTTAEQIAAASALLPVRAAAAPKPPVREIGSEFASFPILGTQDERAFIDDREFIPELTYPGSIPVYSEMATESQVAGLWLQTFLAIQRFRWFIDPAGASEQDARMLADDLGLPLKDEASSSRSQVQQFQFNKTLARIILAARYGHYHFQVVGEVADGGRGAFRLKKLAPRPPWTLADLAVNKAGDLLWVKQNIDATDTPIPAAQLASFVWGEEEGGPYGRSMLRPLYRSWFLKRTLLKVDTIKHERNGMGVPYTTAPESTSPAVEASLVAAAAAIRAGGNVNGSIPYGSKLDLLAPNGSLPDTIGSVRYHDEQMSKALGQMVVDLAQTSNGSRALGDTFADMAHLARESIAVWIASSFTTQVNQKVSAWNHGEGAPAPVLWFEPIKEDLALQDFATLVEKGAITTDEATEDYLRAKYGLPEVDRSKPRPALSLVPPAETVAAAGMPASLAERGLRRLLTEQEIAAATDFDKIDQEWRTALIGLLDTVKGEQASQIKALAAQVEAHADDPAALAAITGVPYGAQKIAAALRAMAARGVEQVKAEAKKQGHDLDNPDPDDFEPALQAKAQAAATQLGNGLAQAASNKAQTTAGAKPEAVAATVTEHLEGLSDAFLVDTLGGALTTAQNTGRRAAIDKAPSGTRIYASALLDANACGPCAAEDGEEFDTLEEAERDFPSGGYVGCEGGQRCRCTLVAVLPGETPASVGVGDRG